MAGVSAVGSNQAATSGTTSTLDKTKIDFFKLLVAQLRNQNVFGDQKSNDQYLTELAQFQSLDQMSEMNKTMKQMMEFQQLQQSSSLLGKAVELADESGNSIGWGQVERVTFQDGKPMFVVGGNVYDYSQIISIQ